MTRPSQARRRKKAAPPVAAPAPDSEAPQPIIERPDGYYWAAPDGRQQFGPFESYELAQADRDAVGDEALAPGDTLQEVEREVGIADWIDAETGAPAEGQSPPHLRED